MIFGLFILSFGISAESGAELASGFSVELEERFSGRQELTTSLPYQYSEPTPYQYYDEYEYDENNSDSIFRSPRNHESGKIKNRA